MATALTHIAFVNDLKKNNPAVFKKLNINFVYSGALFPDYYGFYKIQLKKNYEIEKIIKNKNGIAFGKKMLRIAQTKEERSFAVGFITHSVLDEFFHKYLRKINASIEEHLMLEFFYDCKFKKLKIPVVVYPTKLIENTLKKYYSEELYKKKDITKIKLFFYYLFLKEIQTQIIYKKYLDKKMSYIDIVSKLFYRGQFDLSKLLQPDLEFKKKHFKNLETAYVKALTKNQKILNKLNVS